MGTIFIIAAVILIGILIWFIIPFSPLKSEFERECQQLSQAVKWENHTFSEKLCAKPVLLQKFIKYCGLDNKPMMKYAVTKHRNADFLLTENSPMTKIQYSQINFAASCERAAFIDTKLFSLLPFQGLDDNIGGKGRMKGVGAKLFTIFDVQGREMDQSALVTVLAEGIICPSFLMQDKIAWEELDHKHLKATLAQYGMKVSGIFEFDEDGVILSFFTKDRFEESNGTMTPRDWKVECGSYKEKDGILRPTVFRGIWIYPKQEKVYFHCKQVDITYY